MMRYTTTQVSVPALLQGAINAQRTGDPTTAERLLRQAIAIDPRSADAWQLLGLVAKAGGDLQAAAAHMRQSLSIDNRQAHVHHNLGNVLKAQGLLDDALAAYGKAVTLKPDYVDALVQRGEMLIALQRHQEALPPLRRAFHLAPGHLGARVGLADLLVTLGALDEAEAMLRDGLRASPGNVYLTHNLGVLLRIKEDYAAALPLLRHVVAQSPGTAEAWLNLGNVLTGTGDFDEAVDCYHKVLALDPLHANAHDNLNKLLWEMGRHEELMRSFDVAKAHFPDRPDLRRQAARTALSFERFEEAGRDIDHAERLAPGDLGVARLRTALLARKGDAHAAVATALAGLERYPDDPDLLRQAAEACLRTGDPAHGLALARRLSALEPTNQFALAYTATAARMLGDGAYPYLYDYERVVTPVALPPPAGYASIEAFNAALLADLSALHVGKHAPINQTLRHGTQTRESLFTRADAPQTVRHLASAVLAAVDRVRAAMPADDQHPFFRRRAEPLSWAGSWSVRLREEGFHTDHIHPMGWISGCYYVEVPDVAGNADDKPGWIKFGQPNLGVGGPDLPWEKAVRPRPGTVVLFPSYMWHGTIPFHSDERRTTVAFDIAAGPRGLIQRG